jgi:hypothetical protein
LFAQLTKEQIAVVAAAVAAFAVLLAAFINFLASGRSKYVEVIAAQRIKWVDDLRENILEFTTALDSLIYCVQRGIHRGDEYDKHLDTAGRQMQLVMMKMNLEKTSDTRLIGLMRREMHYARCGDYQEFTAYADLRLRSTYDLLKDEWEKAKLEAAGPIRWTWLWLKGLHRQRRRQAYWSHPARAQKLAVMDGGFTAEEKQARFPGGKAPHRGGDGA